MRQQSRGTERLLVLVENGNFGFHDVEAVAILDLRVGENAEIDEDAAQLCVTSGWFFRKVRTPFDVIGQIYGLAEVEVVVVILRSLAT